MQEKWSESAWAAAAPIYEKIIAHPFVQSLADGTLSEERFRFYLRQDALYLRRYARRLLALAARLPRDDHRDDFMRFASEGMATETALHALFLRGDIPTKEETSPTCLLYTSVLDAMTLDETEIAAASVLPCFSVYQRVGERILACADLAANPYRAWIETYGDESFASSTRRAEAVCDDLAQCASPDVVRRMTEAFVLCTRMEYLFWDSAWNMEQWKI